MNSVILAIGLCQIHMQAVEYILDDQTINSEQGEIVSLTSTNCCSFKKEAVISG